MLTLRPDIQFVEQFFNRLAERTIDYCIMRNAAEVSAGDAHDIDMCIRNAHLEEAERLLQQKAEELGWKLHLKTGSSKDFSNIKCYNYYYCDTETEKLYIVHIDIFPTYAWKGYELLSNDVLLEGTDTTTIYHCINPTTESVCNLFIRLLYNGKIKDKYKPSIRQTFLKNKQKTCKLMRHFLSHELADFVYNCAIEKKWKNIDSARLAIVQNIKKMTKRNNLRYAVYILSKALKRRGIIIAFQGTDGSGKSTIIKGIKEMLCNTFSNDTLNYYHWRPGIIKPENRSNEPIINHQPHLLPPYGKILSFGKMLFYTADYILGYWLKVYWQAAQGHLVVFDRYYYDFYIDKLRYRLNTSNRLIRFLQYFIPEPDMTFVLLGDAAKIQSRKNELPLDEVRKQISTLKKYKESFASPVIIDVCRPIPQVVYDVALNILNKLVSRGLPL